MSDAAAATQEKPEDRTKTLTALEKLRAGH